MVKTGISGRLSHCPVPLVLTRLNCVQHASISTWVNLSTFARRQHSCVSLLLARGDIAMPGGLYAGLWHAFLVCCGTPAQNKKVVSINFHYLPQNYLDTIATTLGRPQNDCQIDYLHVKIGLYLLT